MTLDQALSLLENFTDDTGIIFLSRARSRCGHPWTTPT